MIRNAHFYNQNEGRAYPVDDTATAVSDRGTRLPPGILADASLRWPLTLGGYAFLAAATVTDALVTLTFQAADTPTAAGRFAPLAVVSVRQPVQQGRMVAVAGQAAGVAGWVVFGSGVETPYAGRFSSPEQGLLTQRAARPYRPLPVESLQAAAAADRLTGVVTLKADDPLAITKEERFLAGAYRDCIVVRLVDGAGVDGFPVPADAAQISGYKPKSVFQQFAGPCGGRPEANTCGCPAPIELVNTVGPDCDGVVTIEFTGCAQVAHIQDLCGAAITCPVGVTDACTPPLLPTSAGLLPSETTLPPGLVPGVPVPPPPPPTVPPPPPGVSDSYVPIDPGLTLTPACFAPSGISVTVVSGDWVVLSDGDPTHLCGAGDGSASLSASDSLGASGFSFQAETAGARNLALLGGDVSSVHRSGETAAKMKQGPQGAKHNAQLVINYREDVNTPDRHVYYAAEVDFDSQEFKIVRFDGTPFRTAAAVVSPGIQLDKWYKLSISAVPGVVAGEVDISASLESLTDVGVTAETLTYTAADYQPSTGSFGIGTNRAVSRFSYLKLGEA